MSTAQLPAASSASSGGFRFGVIKNSPEIAIAIAVVGMLLLLVFPLPAFLLDTLLGLNLALATVIMVMAIWIAKPLDFASFPTVLLLTTLFRLCLNVATTRGILLHGNDEAHLSKLVMAFGNIVVGGNFAVGFVIFLILMIINFMVITKGAGRIAEVAARFTLDAMPGKQMAIDAELNAGHINADEARKRRAAVENEADFYGAMDGASKFVRGDAIAGLIITVVNMLVGLVIGVVQHGMGVQDSAARFTLLAVGDGLIASIPALLISTAAGMIVTRSTSEGNLGTEIVNQARVHPRAFYIASGLIGALALLPGFPKIAFFSLSGMLWWLGRISDRRMKETAASEAATKAAEEKKENSESDSLDSLMKVDILSVEVGHALIALIDPAQDGEVVERVQAIRKQFAQELGIIVPQVQLRDNLHIGPGQYQISLKGNRIATGNLMVDYFMAMDPGNVEMPMHGEPAQDPVYGLPTIWVHKRDKDEATFRGYTVVNCATIIATHLTKVIREHAAELITRQEIHDLVEKLKQTNPKVVEEVLHPDRLNLGDILKVMQQLLKEDISIRDVLSVFECLADHCRRDKNPENLAELCRRHLGRAIVQKFLNTNDELVVISFDRVIEDTLVGALVATDDSCYLNMEARVAHDIINKVAMSIQKYDGEGSQPVLMIARRLRSPFQKLISRWIPQLAVIAHDEIPAGTKLKTLEMIS
jgi:flagellar biosynthesis protein FlhA